MSDGFDLDRFVKAQAPLISQVLRELRAGEKSSHWMWFIFPQVAGLGHSPMSRRYAIRSLDEAEAYMAHATLGPRLIECSDLVNAVEGRSAHAIFGSPDDMKFQSSMTLFAAAAPDEPAFRFALERYFGGAEDRRTIDLLISRRS
jgi:uncharacterized protein (DUF1810 family)